MSDLVFTSICIPKSVKEELKLNQIQIARNTNNDLNPTDILLLCVRKWLKAHHHVPVNRSSCTSYNREASDLSRMSVSWHLTDYNVLRARAHMMRMSVSYIVYQAYRQYAECVMSEIGAHNLPPDDEPVLDIIYEFSEKQKSPLCAAIQEYLTITATEARKPLR